MAINMPHIACAACACLALGCGGEVRDSGAPSLTLLDTVVLQESESLFIGLPEVTFAVDDSGNYYVPDVAGDRLLSFDRAGHWRMIYGGPGDGPGELRNIYPGLAVLDSMVLQASNHYLHVFNRLSGRFLFRIPVSGAVSQIVRRDSMVGLAAFDPGNRSGLLLVSERQLAAPGAGAAAAPLSSHLAAWPPQYRDYPALLTYYSSNVIPHGDGWLAGFAGVADLVLYSTDGTPLDTVTVPWRKRTGNAATRYEMLRDPADRSAVISAVSALSEMGEGAHGRVILIHQDYRLVNPDSSVPFESRAWVSLLSAGLDSACVDAELPFPGSHWPRVTIRGDTVYALDQVTTTTDSLMTATVIRRYLAADADCRWLRTGR